MKPKILLPLILLLGLALRLIAVHFGLPYLYHADEPIVVNHALAYGSGDLNPHFFRIPPLTSYLLFFSYGIFFVLGFLTGTFANVSDFEQLFFTDPSTFYLIARIFFGSLLGTATLLVFYHSLEKHFSASKALLATFLLAINFLHVRDSHYIYADIPLLFMLIVAFGCILNIHRSPDRLKHHILFGLSLGASIALKYNGVFILVPYLYVCLRSFSEAPKISFALITAAFFTTLTFIALNPYSILDYSFFMQEIAGEAKARAHGTEILHHFRYSLVGSLGIPLLALSLCALGASFFKKEAIPLQATALFVLVYYGVLIKSGQNYDRYVLPMLPFMILLSANFLMDIVKSKIWLTCSILLISMVPFTKSLLWNHLMLQPDTRTLAKSWVEARLGRNNLIALGQPLYLPKLNFSKAQLNAKKETASSRSTGLSAAQLRRIDYRLTNPKVKKRFELYFLSQNPSENTFLFSGPQVSYNLEKLKARGIQFVILEYHHDHHEPEDFYKNIEHQAILMKEFSPYVDGPPEKLSYDSRPLTGGPFTFKELWHRDRNGPVIRIYRL